MKKNMLTPVLMVLFTLVLITVLSGCMRTAEEPVVPDASAMPTPMPDGSLVPGMTPAPGTTLMPGATMAPSNTVTEPFDWKVKAALVEQRIDMFSEIAESRIVALDKTALVGVKFASQYQGEMTQRIRDMIAGEVMAADPNIEVVAVTADAKDVDAIYQLSDQLKNGVEVGTLKDDIDKIVRNTTTLR